MLTDNTPAWSGKRGKIHERPTMTSTAALFARRETERERCARISRKHCDQAQAAALRRLWA